MRLDEINVLSYEEFVAALGNSVEHCPFVAAAVWDAIPFATTEQLLGAFDTLLDKLPAEGKAGVLRCHPDLAGRLAKANQLTDESKMEQQSAGLDTMTADECALIEDYNTRYKKKFGFPFVICARENKKAAIIQGMKERLENDRLSEINTGINEVKKICKLRIMNVIDSIGSS